MFKRVDIMAKTSVSSKEKIRRVTVTAVLSALSIVLMATIRFPLFPSAAFYEMEFSDIPILVCSGLFGPVYALISLFTVCLIQAITVSSASGIIGFLMHFLSSGFMVLVIWLYRKKVPGKKGIILSSLAGVTVMTFVMIPMNIWMVGVFMNIDTVEFLKTYMLVCVGFNVIKSAINITVYNLIIPKLKKEFNKLSGKKEENENAPAVQE